MLLMCFIYFEVLMYRFLNDLKRTANLKKNVSNNVHGDHSVLELFWKQFQNFWKSFRKILEISFKNVSCVKSGKTCAFTYF